MDTHPPLHYIEPAPLDPARPETDLDQTDKSDDPDIVVEPPDGIRLVPPDHPDLRWSLYRGAFWPLVENAGASYAYPSERGMVSFYHEPQRLANGEWFDPEALTAAHRSLPFGTIVRCTRIDTGKSVVVTINDRGPYKKGRILDLSLAAARAIDLIGPGVTRCVVEVLAYPLIELRGPRGNG